MAERVAALPFEKRSERYFAGLDETVTVVKGLAGGYAVRENGQLEPLTDVISANAAAWRSKFGTLTPEVVAFTSAAPPTQSVPLAFVFDPLDDWDTYLAAMDSDDLAWQAEQRALIKDAIAEKSAVIAQQLLDAGATEVTTSVWTPVVQANVQAGDVFDVSDIQGVGAVMPDGTAEAEENANNVVANPATFHQIGSMPPGSFTGVDKRAATIEPGVCRVRGTHTMIDGTVNYPDSGAPCVSSAGCTTSLCGTAEIPHACVSGKCVDGHGTAVMSVLTRFVPDAELYYPNGGDAPEGPVCNKQITSTYDYLVSKAVTWVNESYSCLDDTATTFSTFDGVVQDYHSRASNMFITKSAGNGGEGSPACKNTWNSVCVGSFDAEKELSCFSSTDNPFYGLGSATIDREEPDVMAYGGQSSCSSGEVDTVTVARPSSNTATVNASGTSFAAPAMLGMAMLVDDYCKSLGKNWNSVDHRSVLRTAGFAANIDGWAYSTLQDGSSQAGDHADGGGGVFLATAPLFCNDTITESQEWGVSSRAIRPNSDGHTGSVPNTTPQYPDAPPSSVPQNQGLQPSGSLTGYRWLDLWEGRPSTYAAGTRIRATFSWDACVVSGDPSSARSVPTDFDLFLYNRTLDQGLYASQTDDDVNEGFDVILPEGWGGDYDLILIWPDGTSESCNGGTERTAVSWFIKK